MPRYGFNFQWMFDRQHIPAPAPVDLPVLDFLAEHGFNAVRLPLDYRYWTTNAGYFDPVLSVWDTIDTYVEACWERGIQLCLNLHRAPGYCINGAHLEQHNLWLDAIVQDAFVFIWEQLAWRYRGAPGSALSFDLVNEPPHEGQRGFRRDIYAALIRRTTAAIRAIDPDREIVIGGVGEGNLPVPELADLGATHSTRGYQPMPISHHGARWWAGHQTAPAPAYPGLVWQGLTWDRTGLEAFYQPWRELQAQGVSIHVGEFGCFRQTPNEIALRWLADLLGLFHDFGWGYSLWQFSGPFGVVEHGRPGAGYEMVSGFNIDRALFDLLLGNRL